MRSKLSVVLIGLLLGAGCALHEEAAIGRRQGHIRISVHDQDGRPVSGVTAALSWFDETSQAWRPGRPEDLTTDRNGTVTSKWHNPGRWRVTLTLPTGLVAADGNLTKEVTVEAGRKTVTAEFVIRRGGHDSFDARAQRGCYTAFFSGSRTWCALPLSSASASLRSDPRRSRSTPSTSGPPRPSR